MTPESRVLSSICRYLDSLRPVCYYMKVRGGPYSVRGLPDIVGCYRGQFFAWEVKGPKGIPTPLQRHVIRQIVDAGGQAEVIRSVKEAKETIFCLDINAIRM